MVRGCELNDSANGVFCGSEDGDPNELSADVLMENSWIHDNGFAGNYDGNEISTESRGVVLQYNLIGPLRSTANGYEIRDRSSARYCAITRSFKAAAARPFGLCKRRAAIGIIDADPAYRTNFVYGNVFYNPPTGPGLTMFLYDTEGIQGQPRNGTLYFYNNTVVNYADQSSRYSHANLSTCRTTPKCCNGMSTTCWIAGTIFSRPCRSPAAANPPPAHCWARTTAP